ncbi:MAG: methyltransferase domain-containing protein [Verrucomicrobiae bacterium]|nr:methyltransferase domain-containing protein [Verrucomicrobiae bacterium]
MPAYQDFEYAKPDFWNLKYKAGYTPWDLGGVPAEVAAWLAQNPGPGRILVPGCGAAYEIATFAQSGWEVIGIDFSPEAVKQAHRVLDGHSDCVHLGDFFTYELEPGSFDAIYERCFLCSLPQKKWERYAKRAAELLKAGGQLFGTFLYGQPQKEPPPLPMTPEEATALFQSAFHFQEEAGIAQALPVFGGMERWQVWRKR